MKEEYVEGILKAITKQQGRYSAKTIRWAFRCPDTYALEILHVLEKISLVRLYPMNKTNRCFTFENVLPVFKVTEGMVMQVRQLYFNNRYSKEKPKNDDCARYYKSAWKPSVDANNWMRE